MLSAEIQVQPPSEDDPKTQGGRNQGADSGPAPFLLGAVRGGVLDFSSEPCAVRVCSEARCSRNSWGDRGTTRSQAANHCKRWLSVLMSHLVCLQKK